MALIIEITVHWSETEKNGPHHEIVLIPKGQDPATLKQQVGAALDEIRQTGGVTPHDSYWYVVLKARKLDGSIGYRTLIGKTFF